MTVHDARDAAPVGFAYVGDLSEDKPITLEIGLVGNNIPGLVDRLYAVSTPGSPSYGQHLTKEEAESYAKPTDEALRNVNEWLSFNGVQSKTISPSSDRLEITLPVSKANRMFQTKFSTFRHTETGTESFQTLSYSLPSQVKHIIQSIEPTTSFPNPSTPATVQTFTSGSNLAPPACNQAITPGCLQTLYGIPTTRSTRLANVLSVAGFLNQYANRADLAAFLALLRKDLIGATFADLFINGGENPQDPGTGGVEANLDIQYTVGLVNFGPVVFFSSGLSTINGFTDMANFWLRQPSPPTVVSISYGFNEYLISPSSAINLCSIFAQLGARGVSVILASGDGGVSGTRLNNTCTSFIPTFPASCPFITAVGATGGYPAEVGAGLSAGGFSRYFARPSYQSAAVDSYREKIGTLYEGRFNPDGRAYPDISAQGKKIFIAINESGKLVDGTSGSAPIFASIIAILNDRYISRANKQLGFLNPLIYAHPEVFKDITTGNNPGCNTSGFPATPGWDPVTGLGTPNFVMLANLIGVGRK